MLRRGLAFCLVLGLGTVARAGAVIDFTISGQSTALDANNCFVAGQQYDLDVRVRQSPAGTDHLLRFTQLDFTNTAASLKAGLTLPTTHDLATDIHFWNFNGVPNCPTPTTATCGAGHYIEDSLSGSRANVISRTYFFTDPNVLGANANAQTLLKGDGTPLVLGKIHFVMPAAVGDYTLDVLNAAQATADLGGADIRYGFGPDAPAPADPITKLHAGTDITGGTLALHVLSSCTTPCVNLVATSSYPVDESSLWRSAKNTIHLVFDGPVPSTPTGSQLFIQELQGTGACSANLASGFTFSALATEGMCSASSAVSKRFSSCTNDAFCGAGGTCTNIGKVLKIRENTTALTHRKWYEIRNHQGAATLWPGVCAFDIEYVLQTGDANTDKLVTPTDISVINAGPAGIQGDASRLDINGDGFNTPTDVSVANAKQGGPVARPTNCSP